MIIIIRTGATNIADYLLYEVRVPEAPLTLALAALVAGFGWASFARADRQEQRAEAKGMPATGAAYWAAMLSAGVFGTVAGDVAQHVMGQGTASLVLAVVLAGALLLWRATAARLLWIYWLAVAVARTTGTAIGDFLAEDEALGIGLGVATLITGAFFVAVLLFARAPRRMA